MRERVMCCCKALRLGQQAGASDLLIPILESCAVQLGNLPATDAIQIEECLGRALRCQQSQDLIALADELEYVMLPLFEANPG